MEAVYRSCNTNFFGTRNRRCEVFSSDVKGVDSKNIDRTVLEYSLEDENSVIDGDISLKSYTQLHGVTGSAVLLWLPPPVSTSDEPKHPLHEDDGCVIFINIHPSSSNGLKNQLNLNGGCEMEQKYLVNIISKSDMPVLGSRGRLVTVHDVAISAELLGLLKSQAKLDNFCQNIIGKFRSAEEEQGFPNQKVNIQVIFQVQNECWYGDILKNIISSEYTDEKLESEKEEESQNYGGLHCGSTEKTDWSSLDFAVTGSRTYHAAYVSPIIKTLQDVEHKENFPKSLFYLASKALQHKYVGFCLDLKNCVTPNFEIFVENGSLLLSVDSDLPLCLSVELPCNLKLEHAGKLQHWNLDNTLYFVAKGQTDLKEKNSKAPFKKILDHSASVDSGIGSDELQYKNWLSFDMLEVGMDDVFGHYDNSLNSNEILELFGQKLLENSFLLQSDFFDSLKIPMTCAIADQKPICDTNAPATETKIRKNYVAPSPSFEISQTIEKVHVAVSCSNLYNDSVEISKESKTMIGISFLEVDQADRQHIYVSSLDPSSHTSLKENKNLSFKDLEKNGSKGLDTSKNVFISPEKVLVSLIKSSPENWDAVWAGPKGKLAKVALSAQAQPQQKQTKNAEPLRIEQQPASKVDLTSQILTNDSYVERQDGKSIPEAGEAVDIIKEEASEPSPQSEPNQKPVNVNKKKKLGKLVVPVEVSGGGGDDGERTADGKVCETKAVKSFASPLDSKEKSEVDENEHDSSTDVNVKGLSKCTDANSNRYRRSSECVIDTSVSDARKAFPYRPRSILKRRGRSYSESHVGSLEECLGEELLGKYGSVEKALVVEYGCFEGLREECGWDEEEDDEAFGRSEELDSSVGSKKNVRFNDVSKTHLFMSKASILNQIANDDKKAMRMKMKEMKKKQRTEKRIARRSGSLSGSPRQSYDSSYRSNNGYSSQDEGITTEESDGCELVTSSSGETTDNTTEDETDNEKPITEKPIMEPSVLILRKNKKPTGRKRGRKSNKKRVELTNNMIFQLDMEA